MVMVTAPQITIFNHVPRYGERGSRGIRIRTLYTDTGVAKIRLGKVVYVAWLLCVRCLRSPAVRIGEELTNIVTNKWGMPRVYKPLGQYWDGSDLLPACKPEQYRS